MASAEEEGPSASRKWLLGEGYRPSAAPGNEAEINSALMSLLAKRDDAPAENRSDDDPLVDLGWSTAASAEGAWAEARRRLPQAVLRQPYGGPVSQAFDLTLDVVAEEAARAASLQALLRETAGRVGDLEAGNGDGVGEKLAALKKQHDEASWDATDRIDSVEATLAGLRATLAKSALDLKHQAEDTARLVAELTAGIAKERRRNIQERFAVAIVMSRLQELKRSLDQNTEGDLELRASVEEMQRLLMAGATSGQNLSPAPELSPGSAGDKAVEEAELTELDHLNAHIQEITAASEQAEARMKEQVHNACL
jgi:hypothetical protein